MASRQVTQGGAFMMGERGPELVYLPPGAAVHPNAGGLSNVGQSPLEATIVVYNQLDGRTVSRSVVRQGLMAQARRDVGGPTISDVSS